MAELKRKFKKVLTGKNIEIIADLDLKNYGNHVDTVSADISMTNCFPDIALTDRQKKAICLVKLTVSFKNSKNFKKTDNRKRKRYAQLRLDFRSAGWAGSFFRLGVGSLGMIPQKMVRKISHIMNF